MKTFSRLFFVFLCIVCTCNISIANDDLLLKSDYKSAYIEYTNALEKDKSAQNYLNMCKVTYYLNDNNKAKEYCNAALDVLDSVDEKNNELRSNILSVMGNIYSNAYNNSKITFDYYNFAKELKEKNPQTDKFELAKLFLNMGYTYYLLNEVELAEDSINKALNISKKESDPKFSLISAGAYNDLGLISKRKGKYDIAKSYFELGVKELENSGEYKNINLLSILYYNLGSYYKNNTKEKDKAYDYFHDSCLLLSKNIFIDLKPGVDIEKIQENLKVFPYDELLNYKMAEFYIKKDKIEESIEYCDKIIKVNPKNTYSHAAISLLFAKKFQKTGDYSYYQNSRKYLKTLLRYAPWLEDLYYNAGEISIYLNAPVSAERYFKKYSESCDDKDEAYFMISMAYFNATYNKKLSKKTFKYAKKALKEDPDNNAYKLLLYSLYKTTGQIKEAEKMKI